MSGLVDYRHPSAGFTLPFPEEWERLEDPRAGIALIAVEPDQDAGFRANVVVTVDEIPDGMDVDSWQAGNDELLPQALDDYLLLDLDRAESVGRVVVHRLAAYAQAGTTSVTMEQWSTEHERRGYTLTASVATLAYDSLADTFHDMAGQLRCS